MSETETKLPVGQPRLVRLPIEVAKRAINALSYRHNKVMDNPTTHGSDGLASLLMEGANNDQAAMDAINSAISEANRELSQPEVE
jgi:hypothetical protein